jgi:hypothetical protein
MLDRHYAPRTPLTMCDTPHAALAAAQHHHAAGHHPAVLLVTPFSGSRVLSEGKGRITPAPSHPFPIHTLASDADPNLLTAATTLFATLRHLDASQADHLFTAPGPHTGLGRAINDRLHRASQPLDA